MSTDQEPVQQDEFILRRIVPQYYEPGSQEPVAMLAFKPYERDVTGLSFYRERFVGAREYAIKVKLQYNKEIVVARLSVSDLMVLGLTVDPEPDPDPAGIRGHCVAPELSWGAYSADKPHARDLQRELAHLAATDVAYIPTPSP